MEFVETNEEESEDGGEKAKRLTPDQIMMKKAYKDGKFYLIQNFLKTIIYLKK